MLQFFYLIFFLNFFSFAETINVPNSKVKEIIDLRLQLENLGREMEGSNKQYQAELDIWLQKKLELEAALQKESLRKIQIKEKLTRLSSLAAITPQIEKVKKSYLQRIVQLQGWIQDSLPFHREQRLETVKSFAARLQKNQENLEFIANDIWNFYQEEFKKVNSHEYILGTLDGQSQSEKFEIVRLGLFTLFIKDTKGSFKQLLQIQNQWRWQEILSSEKQNEISRLMENLKTKKDSGLYSFSLFSELSSKKDL
ncbi:MAG: DUF3450 family protein [Bdellovibrionales bacterium]|nr:DUF3450 family protein [Bdellovibrionales bacterium]